MVAFDSVQCVETTDLYKDVVTGDDVVDGRAADI